MTKRTEHESDTPTHIYRRAFLGALGATGVAGCLGNGDDGGATPSPTSAETATGTDTTTETPTATGATTTTDPVGDYHVSPDGSDDNDGSANAPFETISAAAEVAQPGEVITVHEGTYRERIDPPRGGTSEDERIVYRAPPDEDVVVKGSEAVDGWEQDDDGIWSRPFSNEFFGAYNPYDERIRGDWFEGLGRDHHTGDVYLNGVSLPEAASLRELRNGDGMGWFGDTFGGVSTRIYARFGDADPNEELVEINARPTVFYPSQSGRDYITVRGFRMEQAATQWAPPTTEQIGLIGTHWSKGWIIEDNEISNSRCTGITLGMFTPESEFEESAAGYNEAIDVAIEERGWSKENVGSHVVRNNVIHDCEQAGMVGSMGSAFSEVTGNHIYNINVKALFGGAEIAGIKFHGPIDARLANNRIHNARRGMWLDWMTQGTRVTGNLFYNNTTDDLFFEVNHGPFVADNNVMLSGLALHTWSQGGAYVHNLIAGNVQHIPQLRTTPYHEPHSTELAGRTDIGGGDERYYNNVFVGGTGLAGVYDDAAHPIYADGNVYLDGAEPPEEESNPFVDADAAVDPDLTETPESVTLDADVDPAWGDGANRLVTTELLGRAMIPDAPYENPDGSELRVTTDMRGEERETGDPFPGPIAAAGGESGEFDVWEWRGEIAHPDVVIRR
jgi:hypothetical protein